MTNPSHPLIYHILTPYSHHNHLLMFTTHLLRWDNTFDGGTMINSPASSSRSSMQFGKGGLVSSGRDSILSISSSAHGVRDSIQGAERGISVEKRPSRTRSEMLDAIKANRQGSGTNLIDGVYRSPSSLNVISIVNTSSINVNPSSSMGSSSYLNRNSQLEGNNDRDVITVPRRISKVMGFNKLEFNPMALDQDRSGPLLELGKEDKKGKEERQSLPPKQQQVQEESHRRGTCILDDNVLGKSVGQPSDRTMELLDRNHNSFSSATNNSNDNNPLVHSQPLTSDGTHHDSASGLAASGQKHGVNHSMPHIHTVTNIEVSWSVGVFVCLSGCLISNPVQVVTQSYSCPILILTQYYLNPNPYLLSVVSARMSVICHLPQDNAHGHHHHHSSSTIFALPKPPSYPPTPRTDNLTIPTASGTETALENSSTQPPPAPTPTPAPTPAAFVPEVTPPCLRSYSPSISFHHLNLPPLTPLPVLQVKDRDQTLSLPPHSPLLTQTLSLPSPPLSLSPGKRPRPDLA